MQLKTHTTLQNGKYEIIRTLGQGGFGITYLAEQTLMDWKVCIKEFFIKEYCEREESTSRVSLGTASNAEMVQRYMAKFIKEAKTIAKLDHPNIVRIHDVFKENDTAYIVMEYIEGVSLSEYIKQNGPLPEERAIVYLNQVGSALSFAHNHRIMHLDVKPSNIMLDLAHDRPVLIDFGLAKQYSDGGEQTSDTPVGISQGYAPLEQYQAGGIKDFSPATDIYSLGATLYKLVTGETPPSATEVNEEGLPPLPQRLSSTVRRAIENAMKPKRKERPNDVTTFLGLLTTQKEAIGPVTNGSTEDEVTLVDKVTCVSSHSVKSGLSPSKKHIGGLRLKYGIIAGVVLTFLSLLFFIPRKNESARDSLLINGVQHCMLEVGSEATTQEFLVTKNFKERWTYSDVPIWCEAYAKTGKFFVTIRENTNEDSRSASIVFRKKDDKSILGKITIKQNGCVKRSNTKPVGAIRFASTPSGASIWIDGKNTQKKTPDVIDGLVVGKHSIKLVLEGYQSNSCSVNVSSKKRMVVDRVLKPEESANVVMNGLNAGNESPSEEIVSMQSVEVRPKFNGGDVNSFATWVEQHVSFPESVASRAQGRVMIQFVINADGSLTSVKVLHGLSPEIDNEVLRVVKNSPKWTPGRHKKKVVRVKVILPIYLQ